ncbi:PREDICTED: NAC domain-containing protein 62-like [Camelina sativa]|uniref:NAC domain-containing protein 62-like n=1 Tax=Camelina sativa TaxID=90675 RepID=A0ABM0ZC01_CAMSA|nr:PREDICTED: NAC domain-containing protein 62-like [Camelina sativa]
MGKGGKKQKRVDKGGYWHATVATKKIDDGGLVGYKTALANYVGKQPSGVQTDWLVHEYWVDESSADAEKIYRSPQAINKKKAEEEENEKQTQALEDDVEQQSRTIDSHQPQQFSKAPLDCYQPQPCDSAYQQRQFWSGPLDSYQPQPHHIAYEQLIFQPAPLDSYQAQPHEIVLFRLL